MEEYTTRQNKIGRLLQKELSELLRRETPQLAKGRILSVTKVRITNDMSFARCYLSIFPSEGAAEILSGIKHQKNRLRGEIGNHIRHQLRIIPELEFYIDDSLDYIDNIDRLLKQ